MKVGFLHSWKQKDLWNSFNSIMIRHQFETWNYALKNGLNYWNLKYGKGSNREKLRDLIYNHTNQDFLLLAQHYDTIFLSINFDIYPLILIDFINFVTEIVATYKLYYPYKEIIVGVGNECWEKVRNIDKFTKIVWDTHTALLNIGMSKKDLCMWNQKVKIREEKDVYQIICKNNTIKSCCKYVGIQSLETSPTTLLWAINGATIEGFNVIDTELMTTTDSFSDIKNKFEIDRANCVDKIFIGCPYVSRRLAKEYPIWEKYALAIVEE